jgi:hypothetical protein
VSHKPFGLEFGFHFEIHSGLISETQAWLQSRLHKKHATMPDPINLIRNDAVFLEFLPPQGQKSFDTARTNE